MTLLYELISGIYFYFKNTRLPSFSYFFGCKFAHARIDWIIALRNRFNNNDRK